MISVAAAGTIALLSLYFAALVVALQHVADRYSPALQIPVLRQSATLPLSLLTLLVLATGVLLIQGSRAGWINLLAFGLLLAGLVTSLWASYRLWERLSDDQAIAVWLAQVPLNRRNAATRDILWQAVNRADPPIATVALGVFPVGSSGLNELLDWLRDNPELLSTMWMTRALNAALLPAGITDSEAQATILSTFTRALDQDAYERADAILEAVTDALLVASPWTRTHGQVLREFSWSLWNIGEPDASIPRSALIPEQIDKLRRLTLQLALRHIWTHLQELGNSGAVEDYTGVLGWLAKQTGDDLMLTRLEDVMIDGFPQGLWTPQALHQLGCDLGVVRRNGDESQLGHDSWIDMLAIDGAAMLVELGDERELRRYLGNARLRRQSLDNLHVQRWILPKSYDRVREALDQLR